MDKDLIKSVKKLGLSTYESKVYLALNKLILGTAEEISKEADIPKSKSYDVLKSLNRKDLIKINGGKPIIYEIIPPKEGFKNHRIALIEELYQCEEKLNAIYEKKVSEVQAPVWLISKEEKIIEKEMDLIKNAKDSIYMRVGFLTKGELNQLIKSFRKTKSHIKIKILTTDECIVNGEKINIIEEFKRARIKNLKIKKIDIPFVKLIIKDSKEMFHIYAKQDENTKEAIPGTLMGILNRYEEASKNYYDRFEKQFNKMDL